MKRTIKEFFGEICIYRYIKKKLEQMHPLIKLHTKDGLKQRYDGALARIQHKGATWSTINVESTNEVIRWRTNAWTNCEVRRLFV